MQQRIQQTKRQELIAEVAAVREEYQSGNVRFGSVGDFMAELDEERRSSDIIAKYWISR